MCCLCNHIYKWLDVQVFSDKDYKTVGPFSCIFNVTWLAGDVKEPTHLSKRVGHVVPVVVVWPNLHSRPAHSAQDQNQVWQIWLVLVSIYCVYKAIQTRNVVGPGQRSRFSVLTKRSAASGDENDPISYLESSVLTAHVKGNEDPGYEGGSDRSCLTGWCYK